jgi:glycosyltransferase involved in cell wall biosynthesis
MEKNDQKIKKKLISVVIPSYNDGSSAAKFALELRDYSKAQKKRLEIIIIDDGSDEHEFYHLINQLKDVENISVFRLKRNFGQQVALCLGLKLARGDLVITVDGDGQYKTDAVAKIAEIDCPKFCLISGVRLNRQDNLISRYTSNIGAFFILRILKLNIKDFGSIKGFSRELVDQILANQYSSPDVYATALSLKPNLIDVEVNHHQRSYGHSRWSLIKRLKMYFDLYLRCSADSFGILFKIGIFLVLASPVSTVLLLIYKVLFGHGDSVFSIISFGAIFFLTGLQFLIWSLIASMFSKLERKQNICPSEYLSDQVN